MSVPGVAGRMNQTIGHMNGGFPLKEANLLDRTLRVDRNRRARMKDPQSLTVIGGWNFITVTRASQDTRPIPTLNLIIRMGPRFQILYILILTTPVPHIHHKIDTPTNNLFRIIIPLILTIHLTILPTNTLIPHIYHHTGVPIGARPRSCPTRWAGSCSSVLPGPSSGC